MYLNKADQILRNEIRKIDTKIYSKEREITKLKIDKKQLENSIKNV